MNFITLNDGNKIPAIGFGTFQIPPDGSTYEAVKTALSLGIRHIDTAVAYFNEQEVGQAVKEGDLVVILGPAEWFRNTASEFLLAAGVIRQFRDGHRLIAVGIGVMAARLGFFRNRL